MRAFVVTGPGRGVVEDVEPPVAGPGTVVVDVERAGVCGTDAEFFSGEMAYLHENPPRAAYPLRIGHEWCGTVSSIGAGVDPAWLGRRVTGDTMLGCGACARCSSGRQHLCHDRYEIGIRGGWPGALAEQLPVPVTALHPLPDSVGPVAGALVEPGANALRAVEAAALRPGFRVLILGSGTIGLLAALFALTHDVEVHVAGRDDTTLELARSLGVHGAWNVADLQAAHSAAARLGVARPPAAQSHAARPPAPQSHAARLDAARPDAAQLPMQPYDAVIDATNSAQVPEFALDLVEPGRRVVFIGIAGAPSTVDTRALVLKEVTAVGLLSGSPGLAGAIEHYASGKVDPTPLVAATVRLDQVAGVLAGHLVEGAGPGPKFHVDPRS